MKYLLSILILFSGLSFTSKYSDEDIFLYCDAPYYFNPDLSRRIMMRINLENKVVQLSYYEPARPHEGIRTYENELFVFDSTYDFASGILDRATLEYKRTLGGTLNCNNEGGWTWNDKFDELREYEEEQRPQRPKNKI